MFKNHFFKPQHNLFALKNNVKIAVQSVLLTLGIPDSSCSTICVFRAMRALNGVGRPRASSKEFVCRD